MTIFWTTYRNGQKLYFGLFNFVCASRIWEAFQFWDLFFFLTLFFVFSCCLCALLFDIGCMQYFGVLCSMFDGQYLAHMCEHHVMWPHTKWKFILWTHINSNEIWIRSTLSEYDAFHMISEGKNLLYAHNFTKNFLFLVFSFQSFGNFLYRRVFGHKNFFFTKLFNFTFISVIVSNSLLCLTNNKFPFMILGCRKMAGVCGMYLCVCVHKPKNVCFVFRSQLFSILITYYLFRK